MLHPHIIHVLLCIYDPSPFCFIDMKETSSSGKNLLSYGMVSLA